jgi:GNAT superfamily N-acetyltransferase
MAAKTSLSDLHITHICDMVSGHAPAPPRAFRVAAGAALGRLAEAARNARVPREAVRAAYGAAIRDLGLRRVDPSARGGGARFDEWFRLYAKSFPIRGERETKATMRGLLTAPMTPDGYGEVAVGLWDPVLGRVAGGAQALVVAEAASCMLTYIFVDPAYQGLGLSRALVAAIRSILSGAMRDRDAADRREPCVFLEKNDQRLMSLEDVILDTVGIDVRRPHAATTTAGAIPQSQRDATWASLGAKEIGGFPWYIQPSLDGVTDIPDGPERDLVVRRLRNAPGLAAKDRLRADAAIDRALGKKAAHCPLTLCVLADGRRTVSAQQTRRFLEVYFQRSCLKTDARGLRRDVFCEAVLGAMPIHGDEVALVAIRPYAGPFDVGSFVEAEAVLRALLAAAPEADVRAAARRRVKTPLSAWLKHYEREIAARLAEPGETAAKEAVHA